jgi:thiol-disulfide isomerase/thioredoxin
MPKLTLFIQDTCPFCRRALGYIDELKQLDAYKSIDIETVNEKVEKERADSYDYYYVPTFYLGDEKLHEGAIYYDEVKALFDKVLERE